MYVVKHKEYRSKGQYLRREPNQSYVSVPTIEEATKFASLGEFLAWCEARVKAFQLLAFDDIQLVEVRQIPQPEFEEVRVIA